MYCIVSLSVLSVRSSVLGREWIFRMVKNVGLISVPNTSEIGGFQGKSAGVLKYKERKGDELYHTRVIYINS